MKPHFDRAGVGRVRFLPKLTLIMLLAACACTGEADEKSNASDVAPTAEIIAFAESARPDDPDLAEIYERSCYACHARVGSGAPLTGHVDDWVRRAGPEGRAGLVRSTKTGRGAMPAMGLCNDCDDEEFAALIDFMAKGSVE